MFWRSSFREAVSSATKFLHTLAHSLAHCTPEFQIRNRQKPVFIRFCQKPVSKTRITKKCTKTEFHSQSSSQAWRLLTSQNVTLQCISKSPRNNWKSYVKLSSLVIIQHACEVCNGSVDSSRWNP